MADQKNGPPTSPTMRDAIRGDLSEEEIYILIEREFDAILVKDLRAAGLPCVPVAVLKIAKEKR